MATKYKNRSVRYPVKFNAFDDIWNIKRTEVVSVTNKSLMWNESLRNGNKSFVDFVQIISVKNAATPKRC